MKRLYLQIYLTIVASLVLVVLTAGVLWHFTVDVSRYDRAFDIAAELASTDVPAADAPLEAQQEAVARLAERLHTDVALFSPTRERIAAVGRALPAPSRNRRTGGFYRAFGPAWSTRLADGRWLAVRVPVPRPRPGLAVVGFLGGIALVVALAALPVARRVTRRLERLQRGVESLGAGDLAARVRIEGRDEVARLAESFNGAAARIETLVGAHKMLLANASHELRTPLTRIRLGIELLKDGVDQKRKTALERDIAELNQLIDEILLASRLDAVAELDVEEVDLLALAAEEGARYEHCSVEGAPVMVRGDPRLLRRMIRNLIENAMHHGKPPVEVDVRGRDGAAALRVCDHGPGIAAADRDRMFSPFFRPAGATGERGAGLGLALVRQIARRHAGEVVYGPHETCASCFTVTVPTAHA